MADGALSIGLWLFAYLVGAIPFGYIMAQLRGVDISKQGSGNIGATNVARVLGKRLGLLVLLLDVAKGAGPGALALALRPILTWPGGGWLEVGAGLAALLGHVFPVYLRFRGGKGVATGAGVVTMLVPFATLGALVAWLLTLLISRYVSVASVAAALAMFGFQLALADTLRFDPRTLFCFLACTLVIVRHRSNLGRILRGEEYRIKETLMTRQLAKTVHVLAMGLWFGSVVFFTFVVGLSLFGSFEKLGELGPRERPAWFPLPASYDKVDAQINGPREQGVRAAGFAVAPMFPVFFALQGICGIVASATAFGWARSDPTVKAHRWRNVILLLAMVTVLLGWPLEQKVSALRGPRNLSTDLYLESRTVDEAALEAMQTARGEFGRWHLYSLLLNFATLLLVTGGMALTAKLPATSVTQPGRDHLSSQPPSGTPAT